MGAATGPWVSARGASRVRIKGLDTQPVYMMVAQKAPDMLYEADGTYPLDPTDWVQFYTKERCPSLIVELLSEAS